jgi:hypothetical protein
MMLFVEETMEIGEFSHEVVTLLRMICLLCVCVCVHPVCANYSASRVVIMYGVLL